MFCISVFLVRGGQGMPDLASPIRGILLWLPPLGGVPSTARPIPSSQPTRYSGRVNANVRHRKAPFRAGQASILLEGASNGAGAKSRSG
jgi:hypothetical protein